MWFMLRAAFCIAVVFSMAPGNDGAGGPVASGSLSSRLPQAAMREIVDGALSVCSGDPKLCLELAQRLAGFEGGETVLPKAKLARPEPDRLVSDTLTASDRAAAWRGSATARPSARLRSGGRPAT
jgi:hypothetical protein